MFNSGNIIHIEKYIFPDGVVKNTGKFLVVLYNNKNISIIATLTTTKDSIPEKFKQEGCIYKPDINFHCYYIPKNKEICKNKYSFKKDTFIYINPKLVFEKQLNYYDNTYNIKDIEIVGNLNKNEYEDLVYCIYKSKFTVKKIKRILKENVLDKIE